MTFEIFRDSKGLFRFRIRAGNQKIVAQSEGYKRKQSVKKAVKAIINGIRYEPFRTIKLREEIA
jgi:uncharacterized protein YegP (UPF0339 family)